MAVAPIAESEGHLGMIKEPRFNRSLPVAAAVNAAAGLGLRDNGNGAFELWDTLDTKEVCEGCTISPVDNSASLAVSQKQATVSRKGWFWMKAQTPILAKVAIAAAVNGQVRAYISGAPGQIIGRSETAAVKAHDILQVFLDL